MSNIHPFNQSAIALSVTFVASLTISPMVSVEEKTTGSNGAMDVDMRGNVVELENFR